LSEVARPVVQAQAAPAATSERWLRAARRARALSWLSLVWMGAEGAIAITAGILAGSIALVGFGLDSAIEGVASLVIVWRFTGHRLLSEAAEERAQKLVAIQFFLLAPYVAIEAVRHLATAEHPETSVLGMALTATSLVGMPFLGLAKQRLARTLGSTATHGEGAQNLLCAYLAGAVFLGLVGNAALGWWWLDPIAALVIAAVAVHEGLETWRGEGCCAPGVDGDPALLAECRLDLDGLRAQQDRYRQIGEHIERLERRPGRLDVWLDPAADPRLVEATVEVERGCCPFYAIDFNRGERRLSLSIGEPAQDPALDAIRYALTGSAD
jgi:hypothetical protein